jgi:hypothetical protein
MMHKVGYRFCRLQFTRNLQRRTGQRCRQVRAANRPGHRCSHVEAMISGVFVIFHGFQFKFRFFVFKCSQKQCSVALKSFVLKRKITATKQRLHLNLNSEGEALHLFDSNILLLTITSHRPQFIAQDEQRL